MLIYQTSQPGATLGGHLAEVYGFTYFSISLSLTVLVTLMIAVRLTLHSRNVVSAIGAPAGMGGLYKAVMTMLVESYALYAASSILVIGTWFAQSPITDAFLPLLAQTRVCAISHSYLGPRNLGHLWLIVMTNRSSPRSS